MFLGLVQLPARTPLPKSYSPAVFESEEVRLLTAAKKLIQERGWGQKQYHDNEVNFCPMGAMNKIVNDGSWYQGEPKFLKVCRLFVKANRCLSPMMSLNNRNDYYASVTSWNDVFWRTKNSVLRAFDRAIRLAKKEANQQ